MTEKIRNQIKKARERSYLAKDFNGFREQLLNYARVYFPDKIQDFSEASVGGLFLDMAAYIGDTMAYYLDHQYSELDPIKAVERKNIMQHMITAGLEIPGPSPASVICNFYITVDSEVSANGSYVPKQTQLPILRKGSSFSSASGIVFNLTKDIDFAATDEDGEIEGQVEIVSVDNNTGNVKSFRIMRKELCVSGEEILEEFTVGSTHVPFRELRLGNGDVTEVISVTDRNGNTYYEVDSLSQDTVFVPVTNISPDSNKVEQNLEIKAAPRRFVKFRDPATGTTIIRFGSGNAETLDNDIVPDPSKISLPLYGRSSLKRFSIDPSSILNTKTLGISPLSTTITVRYRFGGGLNHNVSSRAISELDKVIMSFPDDATTADKSAVRSTLDITNTSPARGGDSEPTLDELRASIASAKQFQGRIVSKQDVLARVYTLPTEFGRVFRAGIRENPINPLSSRMFIICRNQAGNLEIAPDTLKNNLSTYLNQFRLVSEAMEILDGRVLNFGVRFQIVVSPGANKDTTLQAVINQIASMYEIKNMQIDQPIVLDDIRYAIISSPGVVTLNNLEVFPRVGSVGDRSYSVESFEKTSIQKNGLVVGPPGSIFELKFSEFDIIGSTT